MTTKEIEEIQAYICENIESNISSSTIARKYFVSRTSLHLNFKRVTGTSIGKFIRDKRFARAKEYLEEGKSCNWVAYRMGFCCYRTFLDAYKLYYGVSPSEHKKAEGQKL